MDNKCGYFIECISQTCDMYSQDFSIELQYVSFMWLARFQLCIIDNAFYKWPTFRFRKWA